MEREYLFGKHIIHNYGHGGAGISLAPATAQLALSLAADLLSPARPLAVVGSGVIGLLTAFLLKERCPEASVTVYAERVPQEGDRENGLLVPSEVAPGYWFPFDYGLADQERQDALADSALKWYLELQRR